MSPSGFPALHVNKAAGTVRVILFPVILKNTESSPTVPPKSVQTGKFISVNDVQKAKDPAGTVAKLGKEMLVSAVHPCIDPPVILVTFGVYKLVNDVQLYIAT